MTLLRRDPPMTVDDFLAFTDTRPDEERWELIDGVPILNPPPGWDHQRVLRNLTAELIKAEDAGTPWEVLPGIGVKLSDTRLPVPDLLVRPAGRVEGSVCDDIIVAFEVLSPSSRSRDLEWKRDAYATLPSLQHYVVVSPKKVDVRCYDRDRSWAERRFLTLDHRLDLAAVVVTLPLARLYLGL